MRIDLYNALLTGVKVLDEYMLASSHAGQLGFNHSNKRFTLFTFYNS